MKSSKLKKFLIVNLGTIIMALGLYIFLIPPQLAVGGVTGLAMVVQSYFPSINLGILMISFNFVLFVLAFILIGKEFGGYTIYTSFFLSGVIGLFEIIIPPDTFVINDLFLNLVFGIVIQGIGMAIIFYNNASTGGTDIIAKIINKYTNLEIGKALILSDSIITLFAGITFGVELGLYAFMGVLINGLVIDKVIGKFDSKIHTLIISNEYEKISKFVQEELGRGVTYLDGRGGFTQESKEVLSIVITRKEYIILKKYMKSVDANAFVVVNLVHEVLGEGFTFDL